MGDNKKDILNTKINDLNFSVRSESCLTRHGVKTVEDILKTGKSGLKLVTNLGKRSYEEIVNKIEELGLEFIKNDCQYCNERVDTNNYSDYETQNYKISSSVKVTVSIYNKNTETVIEETKINDTICINYCPFCSRKLRNEVI